MSSDDTTQASFGYPNESSTLSNVTGGILEGFDSKWAATIDALHKIADDPKETPERRLKARRALRDARAFDPRPKHGQARDGHRDRGRG